MTTPITRLILLASTARDLMSENPISLPQDTLVREALTMLVERNMTAAPVMNEAGRAVGVVSVTDILVHECEATVPAGLKAELHAGGTLSAKMRDGYELEIADQTMVSEIMTPAVFAIRPETPAGEVIQELIRLRVHHLFVEEHGVIIGVISSGDVLRRLQTCT